MTWLFFVGACLALLITKFGNKMIQEKLEEKLELNPKQIKDLNISWPDVEFMIIVKLFILYQVSVHLPDILNWISGLF